jgi:Transposase IS4
MTTFEPEQTVFGLSIPSIKITKNLFKYIWRNIHLNFEANEEEDEESEADEGEEEEEIVVDDDSDTEPSPVDGRWFAKAAPFVDHVNKISKHLCRHPGFASLIDEMMRLFKGRLIQTHRMKHKPIKEGYKFYALCCAQSGFVFHFFPDGRKEGNKIHDSVEKLLESVPQRNSWKYVCALDNFFTLPSVMERSRELNIGIVGTARNRPNHPPKEMKEVKETRFSALHLMNHDKNFLVGRWVDNNVVNLVSTIHTGKEVVLKERRKPRLTSTTRNHIQTVWGDNYKVNIEIPKIIVDYNHWMLGVDKADQLIAYYRANIRCRRTWMPIFLQCLDIMRVNAFVIAKEKNEKLEQKDFIESFIKAFNERAAAENYAKTRAAIEIITSPPSAGDKLRRMSSTAPSLPPERFVGRRIDHQMIIVKKQKACVYCSFQRATAKLNGHEPLPSVASVTRACLRCKQHICSPHYNIYHGWNQDR